MQGKTVAYSEVLLMLPLMPNETNAAGAIHGGHIVRHMDSAGALVGRRHSRTDVVTATMERVDFLTSIWPGEMLMVKALLHMVGTTSMEIGVRVEVENVFTGAIRHAVSGYFTFVALDSAGKPTPVPPLILSNDIERERHARALERKRLRAMMRALEEEKA